MTYNWKQWEGQLVDGKFPLHQYLGSSEHDVVFLSEHAGQRAAVKLIPAEYVDVDKRLGAWQQSTALAHPNLLRVFAAGRTRIDGTDVLYVVTEYADEDLSQILPERALTDAECTAMLEPLLKALGYVHEHGMVHGHISPANVMASGNIVKLSGEMLQFPGPRLLKTGSQSSDYDAPEVPVQGLSAASDIWSLGATLLEAVTQKAPAGLSEQSKNPAIPSIPEPLGTIIRNCLVADPQHRWPVGHILKELRPVGAMKAAAVAAPAASPAQPRPVAAPAAAKLREAAVAEKLQRERSGKSGRSILPFLAIGVVLAALIGYFATRHMQSDNSKPAQVAEPANPAPTTKPASPSAKEVLTDSGTASARSRNGQVIRRVEPAVAASARRTISGTVRVDVRVSVDPDGNVTSTALEKHGPSQYFARIARESASEWKFAAPQVEGKAAPSEWVLRYQFRRGGTIVTAAEETP